MRKRILAFLVTVLAVAGVMLASPAQANGSGWCDYGPGDAYGFSKEFPLEGDLSYVAVDANHQLSVTLSTDTPYYNGGNTPITTGHFFSSPIDGDGLWNYRDNWNWDATGAYGQVQRIDVFVRQYNTTNSCRFSMYQ
jgi:hypothetical protein